jgi:hypothetical protein
MCNKSFHLFLRGVAAPRRKHLKYLSARAAAVAHAQHMIYINHLHNTRI